MARDERRPDDAGLAELLEQLFDDLARTPRRLPAHAVPVGDLAHRVDGRRRVQLDRRRIGHEVDHPCPRPRLGEVDRLPGDVDDGGAERVACGTHDQGLGERHHVVDVGERLVRLHHRELRVVGGVHALVAEHPADLEDAIHAADDEPFQVQLDAMRRYNGMSSVLWCVTKGRAWAPPASTWSIGVSTSTNPRSCSV